MKNYIAKFGDEVKNILVSPRGWLSWFIANIITSLPWLIPLFLHIITFDPKWIPIAAAIWAFQMSPFLPIETFLNIAITLFIYKRIRK